MIYTHISLCVASRVCIYVHNNLNLERPDVNRSKGRVPFQFYHLSQGHLFIEFQKTKFKESKCEQQADFSYFLVLKTCFHTQHLEGLVA